MGNITNVERARRKQAEEDMRNLGYAMALGQLLEPIFKAIFLTPFILPFKYPKVVIPIYICIGIWAVHVHHEYYLPENQYARALNDFKAESSYQDGFKELKGAIEKNYAPAILLYGNILYNGKYGKKINYPEAYRLFSQAASQGDATGWYLKGLCLENNQGVNRNLFEANACYKKAKDLGFSHAGDAEKRTAFIASCWNSAYLGKPEAEYNLAICYATGNGISKNIHFAHDWFKKSADHGFAKAQLAIGIWLVKGTGGEKNPSLGVAYCEKAAKQNYAEAFTVLGKFYFEGKVIAQSYEKAVENYKKALRQGSASAAFNLFYCHKNGLGVQKDQTLSIKYLNMAVNKKFIPAIFCLGECYENGFGVSADYTKALICYTEAAKSKWVNDLIRKNNLDATEGYKRLSEIGKWWALANEKNEPQAQCNVGICFFTGNGVKQNYAIALQWFKKAAQAGNAEANIRIADCQFNGHAVEKNEKIAAATYLSYAKQKMPVAMFKIAHCYEYGRGIEQNLTFAWDWYKNAAQNKYPGAADAAEKIKKPGAVWNDAVQKGDAEAQFLLGVYYSDKKYGLDKDMQKSFHWFLKSANQGHIVATHNVGFLYRRGIGVEKNLDLARKFFEKAAEKNYAHSLLELGQMYQMGEGVEQNLTTAYNYYAKGIPSTDTGKLNYLAKLKEIAECWDPAHKGNAQAQYRLAQCYFNGNGIDKDSKKGFEWLKKSSTQGYADAMFDLAEIYAKSEKSEEKQEAFSLLSKAAQQGQVKAEVKLGELYYNGTGVKEDYEKAVKLWDDAAKQQNADAMYLLGNYRFTGKGLFNSGKDVDKALFLWTEAAKNGHSDAAYKLAVYFRDGVGIFSSGKDSERSIQYFKQAALGGNPDAMYVYGEKLYSSGQRKEGAVFLKKAAQAGHQKAKEYVDYNRIR